MTTLEELKATLNSVQDLQSVVKTMKALAAVSIRQYEQAVASLADYNRTIEMGLQIVMQQRYFQEKPAVPVAVSSGKIRNGGAIIFGSDQGLCGQFNEQIATKATQYLERTGFNRDQLAIAAIGDRAVPYLTAAGYEPNVQFPVPRSVSEITLMVQELLLAIEQWQAQQQVDRVLLFYNQPHSGASYRPHRLQLLPLDRDWLNDLKQRAWDSNSLPTFTMDWEDLFFALIDQYLFVSLYRAFAASLASENASRLSSMQLAQKNIEERLDDLNAQYRRQRQSAITSELLDVVAGFEALTQ